MGDADYILAFQKIVMPIALEFSPELVMSQPLLLGRDLLYLQTLYSFSRV